MNVNHSRRKNPLLLSSILLGVFLTAGCGMFRTSESGKEFEAWKEEAENNSRPDPVRQQQMRTELDELRNSASSQQSDAPEEETSRHGPTSQAELDALREQNPTIWRTTPFGGMYYYLQGLPAYFFYNPSVGP